MKEWYERARKEINNYKTSKSINHLQASATDNRSLK